METNRTESTKNFANDSPNHVSLEARIDPKVLRPVQQQLSNALGDRDTTPETTLLKQVSKPNSLRRGHALIPLRHCVDVQNYTCSNLFREWRIFEGP